MSKDGKFGTFGGVFTPSILTILGVIMYLRLPWVMGNSGLWMGLGIIAVAHVISITTGLSISSIATDKNVGAGGPYYIVSRSLGLPIGGTLGLALFVGLSFSISLYVIGFCESFLSLTGFEVSPANLRIAGTVTIVAVTVVTFISTAFAIKTQYFILGAIGLSLVSIVLGPLMSDAPLPATPHTEMTSGVSAGELFAIFFPAVTGFTAGVNMSGDLKDAKRSIPGGTMAAIAVGLVVYVGLAVFLALFVDPEQLRSDSDLLTHIALVAPAVTAGVWGATLSSALGSILGAPRILQALAVDRIMPRIFAKGTGKTNEPRNALLLAFVIGEGGILIAELDVIARVVSMVFLATYGFLNISSAIESWASPDFRPSFRIPRLVSVVGAITCALVMIQLDFTAMAFSTGLLAVLFVVLKRRQLTLDAGDTWEGIWSSIVRAGLHRLNQGRGQRRNWRPNVLAFSYAGSQVRPQLLELSRALITGNGLLTDFELVDPSRGPTVEGPEEDEPDPVGVFRRRTPCRDFYDTVGAACRHHGFTGLDPNTVLLDWDVDRKRPDQFLGLLRSTKEQDFNLLLLHHDPERGWGRRKRIDVWWRPQQGNVALSLALMRFLTRFEPWQGVSLRFLLFSEDTSFSDDLEHAMRGVLTEARVEAKVKVIPSPSRAHAFESSVRQESSDADLVVLGLPPSQKLDEKRLAQLDELVAGLPATLLLRGSSLFTEVLPVGGRTGLHDAIERAQASATELRPLHLPKIAVLEEPAAAFASAMGSLSDDLYRHGLAPVLARQQALLTDVKQLVVRQFEIVRKGVDETEMARARKPAGRAQGGFLFKARKLVSSYEEEELPTQGKALQARVDGFVLGMQALRGKAPRTVRVAIKPDELQTRPDDDKPLARFKRRRRWAAAFTRNPAYEAPVGALQAWYVDSGGAELLEQTLRSVESSSHRLAVQLGKILNEAATELSTVLSAIDRREIDPEGVEDRKRRLVAHVDSAIQLALDLIEGTASRLAERTHELSQGFARDIERLDIRWLVRHERRPPKPKKAAARYAALQASPEAWQHHQVLLLHRAQLGLQIAAFQHRFSVLALKARNDITLEIRSSVLGEGDAVLEGLRAFAEQAEQDDGQPKAPTERDLRAHFDGHAALEAIARDMDEHVRELPDTVTTLSDEAIGQLESGAATEAEEVTVSVRPLVKVLIETEFLDVVNQEISSIPLQEQRTVGVARDVIRLLSFTMGDLEAMGGWDNAAFRKQAVGVAREGATRLEGELQVLRTTLDEFVQRVGQQLETLREETAPYALTSRSDNLSHYIRSRGSQKAVSRVREKLQRATDLARAAFVAALYRRSSGVLLARRLRREGEAARGTIIDRVTTMTHELTPRRENLRALPFYYRQLFSGQTTISETFWVGRVAELERARAAIKRHEQGRDGALFVVGEIGAGKTALCQAIINRQLARRSVYRIVPPPGGTVELSAFRLALEGEVKERGTIEEIVATVPDGAVLMFDDLEMWWERDPRGMAVIDCFVDLVRRHGRRCLFMANLNVHAWRVLRSFVRLDEHAVAVIECEPLPAEALKSIVSLRHGSTGVKFELAGTDEDDLASWRQARLFSRYFDFSGGLVAVALRAWLLHIDKVDGSVLHMRWPRRRPRAEELELLRVELRALLVQLVVHKQVTLRRLRRFSGLPDAALDDDLGALVRMGLVRRDARDVLHVDRFIAHLVTDRLRHQGMLA